ncbi:MAG: UbiA prenyltransferase family protein, partial [Muribaculaceae bacterium]|nr:UbiA prenyltransferase family protein [Muribaculaceae bacterium]
MKDVKKKTSVDNSKNDTAVDNSSKDEKKTAVDNSKDKKTTEKTSKKKEEDKKVANNKAENNNDTEDNEELERQTGSLMERLKRVKKTRWIRFGIVSAIFFAWVAWLGNWWVALAWFLLADIYLTQFIP